MYCLWLFLELSVIYKCDKFKEAEKQGHKVVEQDKQILIDALMNKYNNLVEKINKVKWTIEEKIDNLSNELDKMEYREIIDALREKVRDREIEKGNSNKNNFNILKQQNDWQDWSKRWNWW